MAITVRTELPAVSGPRLNIISILVLLASLGAGGLLTAATGSPLWIAGFAVLGAIAMQAPRIAQAVGARDRPAPRPVHGPAGAGPVLGRAVRRHRVVVDRPADDHDELRRRADADVGHRAGERGRGALLDGARRAAGRARSAGLRAGGELGGADGAARHHRPDDAHGAPPGARADRSRAAAAHRSAVEPVGRHGLVGGDARRRDSRRAAGRDVARGAGGAREAGAHHPRPGRNGDRAFVPGGGQVCTTTTRPRCTCAR